MKKLSIKNNLLLASLIFGMFFGAGNLIFPAHLGQLAGGNWLSAGGGFLISATLLPLAALIALSRTRSTGIYDFAKPVAGWYGALFLILNHLALGPLFATPRTAALGYQFSFGNVIPAKYNQLGLFIFSAIFFGMAYFLSTRETNLLKVIGKILNPAFLLLILGLFLIAFLHPFGSLSHTATTVYQHTAASSGFLEGYNTMDALAALAFGVTIIRTIKSMGIKQEASVAKQTMKSGLMAMVFTALIYLGIIALGAMSLSKFSIADNGGTTLTQIVQVYFGNAGLVFMGVMTILAVFTTAMGLIASFAQDFSSHFPILGYKGWLRVTTLMSFATANFGLNTIIQWTLPFLMLLYPLAMALILPALFAPLFKNDPIIYRFTTIFAALPALLDCIGTLPVQTAATTAMTHFYTHWLPFANIGLGWILPTLVGFCLALGIHFLKKKEIVAEETE